MEEKNFEIIMCCYEKTVTVKFNHPDVSSSGVMEAIVGCMRTLTWSDDQIENMCAEYLMEYSDTYNVSKNG